MEVREAAWRDREIEFRVRASSRERAWSGFEAVLYDASAGYSEELIPNNSVSVHVGAPIFVTTACDGARVHRLQRQGDVKIVPAGYTRIWKTEGPSQKLVMNVWPSLMGEAADAMGVRAERATLSPILHTNDPQIEHLAWTIKAELESDRPVARLFGDSVGLALASRLLQTYGRTHEPMLLSGLSKLRLRRVLDYMHDNLGGDLSMNELALVATMSASHFRLLFKKSTGLSVHQYVMQLRVQSAVELLTRGDRPLAHIATDAGFANQSHMARCIRRFTGVSPAQLRSESLR